MFVFSGRLVCNAKHTHKEELHYQTATLGNSFSKAMQYFPLTLMGSIPK